MNRKITYSKANIWQSCTLCSRNLDKPYVDVKNTTTDEYFTVCSNCLSDIKKVLLEREAWERSND